MTREKNINQLQALVRMLDEPDEKVYRAIRSEILNFGIKALPILEETENRFPEPAITNRTNEIIHTIRVNHTFQNLQLWSEKHSYNLLEAWLLISSFLSSDEDTEKIKNSVDKLYRDIWIELNQNLTALEKIKVVNHIFYQVYQYDALKEKKETLPPYLAGNVLRMQQGNPLSLALLYLIIVQRLNMPVFGVNLPRHFILAYTDKLPILSLPADIHEEKDILFYINPFNKGAIFRKSEIELYLKQLKLKPQEKFFLPCDNKTVIKRLLQEIAVLTRKSYSNKTEAINFFLKALE